MRGLRSILALTFAVGLLVSGATTVSANDTRGPEDAIPAGPGLAELKQAIDEFRASLADLRDACRAEREAPSADVTTARKRQPKAEPQCLKTLKALKAEFQQIRQRALDLEAAYRGDVKQKRADAEQAAKEKEEAAKQKLADEERKQQELAKKATQAPKPTFSPADQLAKKKAQLLEQLKQVEATLAYKQGLLKQSLDVATEYRAKAATATGADRDRYLAKAAQADADAAQWSNYVKEYTARREQLVAEIAKLGLTAVPPAAPKPDELAARRATLERTLDELNDKIAYKWSETERYAKLAVDLRSQAAAATTGELRDKLNAKAAEADVQADGWASLARQYEDQRDAVQTQLDALGKT